MKTFDEFWLFYVREHSQFGTRLLHYIGTAAGMSLLAWLLITGRGHLFPLAFVPGYACAWIGHFFVEHNQPATFKHPLWSLIADYKMFFYMLTGRMKAELGKARANAGAT